MSARGQYRRTAVRRRTDWFRILTDMVYAGVSTSKVAQLIDVPESTVRGWKSGIEPCHHDGHCLLELWCEQMGREVASRPMIGGISR